MKITRTHTTLAALVSTLFTTAAFAQSSVQLYGQVDVGVTAVTKARGSNGDDKFQMAVESGAIGSSRWGLKGSEDLGNGMAAIFQLESSINAENGDSGKPGILFDRRAVAGLKTPYGTLTFGRDYDFQHEYVNKYTTRIIELGDNYNSYLYKSVAGNFVTGERHNRSAKYVSPNWGGFEFGLFGALNPKDDVLDTASRKKGAIVGAGVRYEQKGQFGGALAYTRARYDNLSVSSSTGHRDIVGLSGFYTFSPITLNGAYTFTKEEKGFKAHLFDLGMRYQVDKNIGVNFGGTYAQKKVDGASTKTKGYELFLLGDYDFSKRTKAYAGVYYLNAKTAGNPKKGVNLTGDAVSGINGAQYKYNGETTKSNQVAFRIGMNHKF